MSKSMCILALVVLCLSVGSALAADHPTWTLGANTIPNGMKWDATSAVDVHTTAVTGNPDLWPIWYDLVSVDGPTLSAMARVDRWGTNDVSIGIGLPMGTDKVWSFDITAPPISALSYPAAASHGTAGAAAKLACKWDLYDNGHHGAFGGEVTPVLFDYLTPAGKDVYVSRFSDVASDEAAWCSFYVNQLAGLFPKVIVGGYSDGTYDPNGLVTRDQMAVFMVRALNLTTTPYQGLFPTDVPSTQWAALYIEAMKDADLVGGYGAGSYAPSLVVTRDMMAVFVARGMEMSSTLPAGPATATFTDVPTTYWAYDGVEYCVAHSVAGGYGDGTYGPAGNVTRGQMAVFVYRAFIQSGDNMVVLAGPAVTAGDPKATCGVSSAAADPTTAYVAFDANRLGALVPAVDFVVKDGTGATAASGTVTLSASEIAAAIASGSPYVYATFPISGLEAGTYTLEVTVGSDTMARISTFTIN